MISFCLFTCPLFPSTGKQEVDGSGKDGKIVTSRETSRSSYLSGTSPDGVRQGLVVFNLSQTLWENCQE